MSKVSMSVIHRGTATVYKFSEPVSRKDADAMIAAHKARKAKEKAAADPTPEFTPTRKPEIR